MHRFRAAKRGQAQVVCSQGAEQPLGYVLGLCGVVGAGASFIADVEALPAHPPEGPPPAAPDADDAAGWCGPAASRFRMRCS